jgi:hypothetical protein
MFVYLNKILFTLKLRLTSILEKALKSHQHQTFFYGIMYSEFSSVQIFSSLCERLVDFQRIFFSETALPNESKLNRKHPWKVIYKDCAFNSHLLINMAATGHSCF